MSKLSMVTILSAIIFLFPSIISSSAMADDFDITFKFERKHKCSNTSPKITLSNIPEGTQTFKARLVDRDVTSWNHGGGTVANDGSGVLGKGLTEGYNGLNRGCIAPGSLDTSLSHAAGLSDIAVCHA